MPTATGYFTQKTVTTTTTTTKTVPKQKENVQYFTSQEKKYNNSGPPVPEPRNYKAITNRDMNKILTDVKSGQNKNVVLDTLAALVTDCNATAEVLRSRSSSKTNVNEEQRDTRPFNDLYRTTERTYETYRRSTSLPRSTTPPQPLLDQTVTTTTKSKILPGAIKVLPDAAPKWAGQTETEYTLKLHSPIYRTDGPTPEPKMPRLENDKSPSLEKVCRDFDIEAPARARSISRPRSETPVSRKLIVLEEPKHFDAPICAACREHIYGPCVTALAPNSKRAQKYHPPHFVCNYCLKPLNLKGTYREHDLKPYCHECFYRLFSGHIYATENKISLDL